MHELALCQGLLAEVARVATAHRAAAVTRILVAVGPLSGVEAALLDRAFSVARAGTLANEATLEIEAAPIRVQCATCGAEGEATVNDLRCAACGDWRVRLLGGDELLLKRVELAVTADDERNAEPAAGAGNGGVAAMSIR